MLGGGFFVTQNKTLPGSYINIINASTSTSAVNDRGVVAIALPLKKSAGTVIKLTKADFYTNAKELIGVAHDDASVLPLREIFCHSNTVFIYDMGEAGKVADALKALEQYEFNVLCAYTATEADITTYIAQIKIWRDQLGKKCQVVVYDTDGVDHEGVINVASTVSEGGVAHALTAWVAGAEAGCPLNQSCTNMLYDGELAVATPHSQTELEECIANGELVFHLVYGEPRVLEDLNTLKTTTEDKGEDFKSNQTIRVVDQIANDIAKLFNIKYLGKIANDESGRVSLWGDIVKHHKELEKINAIEKFDANLVTVEQGATKRSVVVNDVITVTNAMTQLYMTVVIQ